MAVNIEYLRRSAYAAGVRLGHADRRLIEAKRELEEAKDAYKNAWREVDDAILAAEDEQDKLDEEYAIMSRENAADAAYDERLSQLEGHE